MSHLVVLARCEGYAPDAVQTAVDTVMEGLGGWREWVRPGMRVVVKPNLLAGEPPERAATTHPAFVEAVLRRLREQGAQVLLADDPAFGRLEEVAARTGLAEVAQRHRVPVREWRRGVKVPSADPGIARSFIVAQEVLEADLLVNLPKLKAHRQVGFSGAVKNLYGCMPGKRKAYWHLKAGPDHRFAQMLVAFYRTLPPALHLMDAVVAMEGNGPRLGRPRRVGVVVGGEEGLAVDWVAAEILGLPLSHRFLLQAAAEQGFGAAQGEGVIGKGPPLVEVKVDSFEAPFLIGTSFSPPRVVWSVMKNLYLRWQGRRWAERKPVCLRG